jgi:hypothetical protein
MEKPSPRPGASVLDIIFWQVSGALIGAAAGAAVVAWATGPQTPFLACAMLAGLLLGGLVGTLWGWKP